MARTTIGLSLAVALVSAFLCGRSSGLSPTCTNTLLTLAPCLDYMKGKSPTPAPLCCLQLGSVVESRAECLCVLVDGQAESMGFKFNQSQALALPGACNVETPPLSECKGVSGATGSSATPSSPSTPAPSAPPKPSAPVNSTPSNASTAAAAAPVDHAAHAVADHADAADAGHADAEKGTSATTESSGGSSHESTSMLPTMFSCLFVFVYMRLSSAL